MAATDARSKMVFNQAPTDLHLIINGADATQVFHRVAQVRLLGMCKQRDASLL